MRLQNYGNLATKCKRNAAYHKSTMNTMCSHPPVGSQGRNAPRNTAEDAQALRDTCKATEAMSYSRPAVCNADLCALCGSWTDVPSTRFIGAVPKPSTDHQLSRGP